MKTKKLSRKLILKRETVSNLGGEMKNVMGGTIPIDPITGTVPSYYVTCQDTCNPYYCYESDATCVTCYVMGTMCQAW